MPRKVSKKAVNLVSSVLLLGLVLTYAVEAADPIFTEDFNGITGSGGQFEPNRDQFESNLYLARGADLPGWSKAGDGAVHVVDHANVTGSIVNPMNFAPMLWGAGTSQTIENANIITLDSPILGSNTSGQVYEVSFLASPSVYQNPSQASQDTEGVLIEVLRIDDTVLASHTSLPGAWAGDMAFVADSFQYTGDGSGGIRFRISPSNPNVDRFGSAIDDLTVSLATKETSSGPSPADGATDVPRDMVLNWTPGEYAAPTNGHKVYLGDNFDDVNDATGGVAQSAASYTPAQRLDFGQTYYWRIDEVNAPPDFTEFKGNVWSFTVEPVGYPIAGENITATASSSNSADEDPNNTINGSGLDADDLHSIPGTDMWLSASEPLGAWIQYEFDKIYKLHEMWVWNFNRVGLNTLDGLKDVTIECSFDGNGYTQLGNYEFAKAPGTAGYAPNTTIDFGNVVAKYVRIYANSNWSGGLLDQYGLSEVRFFCIPTAAREPSPYSGATDVDVDAILSFRAGREAAMHDVYISTDEQAVIDGNAPVMTVTEPSYAPSLDLLASTYYWRVDEVNDVEIPTAWQGEIWNLSTQEYLVVDDFEDFDGDNPIWETWLDGLGFGVQGTPGYYPGNGTGSAAGNETTASTTEETIVYDGSQSMPLFYNNTMATYSEVTANVADLHAGQDWTRHGVKALTLRFSGDPDNILQQMYVKINGTTITYDGDAENLTRARWQMWYIDLASTGVSLSNVTELAIGFERIGGVGGQGVVFLDAIRLYSYDRQLITPIDPGTAGLQAQYQFEGNTNDSSGNARNGTAKGGPSFVAGKVGQAISFDGFDEYVNIDGYKGILADAAGVQHEFTLSAWIKTTADGEIITWGTNTGGQRMTFRVDTVLRVEHGSGNIRGTNGPDLRDGRWHHVAATVPQGGRMMDVRLYVDGSDVTPGSTTTDAFNLTANVDVRIGMSGPTGGGLFFTGLIDDVRMYDRVLSLEGIAWLAGRIKPFDEPF